MDFIIQHQCIHCGKDHDRSSAYNISIGKEPCAHCGKKSYEMNLAEYMALMSNHTNICASMKAPAGGLKYDGGKRIWYYMPLQVLGPLADAFAAGVRKGYGAFNCLEPFEDGNRRLYDGMMRHAESSQIDPLAIDQEIMEKHGIKVYHLAQVAFNALIRLNDALEKEKCEQGHDTGLSNKISAATQQQGCASKDGICGAGGVDFAKQPKGGI